MASSESRRIRATLVNDRDSVGTPAQTMRQEWEDSVRGASVPDNVSVTPVNLGGVSGEWIAWSDRPQSGHALLWVHGGGFNSGSCNTHRDLATRLADVTGARVLTINYRLAPEDPFPAAIDDAVAAYRALLDQGVSTDQLLIGGDSSGAGLALSALLRLRDEGVALPRAAVLISPWVDLALTGPTLESKIDVDPMTSREGLQAAATWYLNGHDPADPAASPLYADLHSLPPLLILAGDHEVLLSDATRFAEKARQDGVDVQLSIWDEMWHCWPAWSAELPEGREALDQIAQFVARYATTA